MILKVKKLCGSGTYRIRLFQLPLTTTGAVNIAIWKITSFDVNLPMKKQRDF